MPEPQQPESHYNLNKLHMIFAIVALLLLAMIGKLIMKDYDREWKNYQEQFHALEIEKTRIKEDLAENKLNKDSDFKALEEGIKKEKENYQKNCMQLNAIGKEIDVLQAENAILDQQYKLAKTQFDVSKFNLEEAQAHHPEKINLAESHYQNLEQKVNKLQLALDDSNQKITAKKAAIDQCSKQLTELEKKRRASMTQINLLGRKLKKIDPDRMTFINQIAQFIRNFPILDLSTPTDKIDQIVLKDITEDVVITQVPKVDRCVTCHLGITNPDYKEAPQPFKTHPNLELYLGKDSAHPMEDFGCTVCHEGRGRGTGFVSSAHTPSSEEQANSWKKKYHWEKLHRWEEPMLPLEHTQASCFKCHSGQETIKGAEKLNLGLQLIERSGCYNCHTIDKYKDWPKTGPDLTQLGSKLGQDWTYRWILNPKAFRHNTWMPAFFGQSNNNDLASKKREEQEIHAIVKYLFAKNNEFKLEPVPSAGDAQKGKELVASFGCLACHQIKPQADKSPTTRESLMQQHGPNLIGLGSKTSPEWIFNWLKDPNRYHPETRMPNLRLSDQEAADIAQYLSADQNQNFIKTPIPTVNESIVNNITLDFLKKIFPQKEAQAKLASMRLDDKLVFSGEKLIGHYGCYACHNINGFENAKPIGTDLTEEGSKPAEKLDFGYIHNIGDSKEAWFKQKLLDPRIFDKDKVREPLDKLVMPNFKLTDEEASAITTALLGFVKDVTVAKKIKPRTPENLTHEEGEKIVRQFNCQACHLIEGQGGAIKQSVKDWLINYGGRSESDAAAVLNSSSPPNLIGEGKKVQSQWLFEFLHKPVLIRPWLKVRMPTYSFNAAHLNALIKYFNVLDKEEFPFPEKVDVTLSGDEYKSAEKLFSNNYFGCAQCHIVGNKMPAGSPDSWAPNFALAKTRLKPGWIIKWLKNPQDLLPGTKMPTYFDPANFNSSGPEDILKGDENEQIRVLRNYLMTLSDAPASKPEETQNTQAVSTPTTEQPATSAPKAPEAQNSAPVTTPAAEPPAKTKSPVK